MRGPDNNLRDCYPVVMSFMVDYPEACLICLVCTNHACPVCMAPKKDFSNLDKKYPRRTVPEMQQRIMNASTNARGDFQATEKSLQKYGLWMQTVCE